MRYLVPVLSALLLTTPALAVVLPDALNEAIEHRMQEFVSVQGAAQVDPDALLDGDWYAFDHFPNMAPDAIGLPDADLDPVTKSVLLLDSQEQALPHTRYKVSYRLEAASPDYPDIQHSYVEVTRFNLGPARHADVLANYGENAAPIEAFGVGPDVSWRFVMTGVMGTRAAPIVASRRVLSGAEAAAADCLGTPCLALARVEGPQGEWQEIFPDISARSVVYADSDGFLPYPARVADDLFALATQDGEDAQSEGGDAPSLIFVISSNVDGQEENSNGLLLQDNVLDDAIAQIWTHRDQAAGSREMWTQSVVGRMRGEASGPQSGSLSPMASAAGDLGRAIIVLDGSGSMHGRIAGKPKFEIARETLSEVLASVPANMELGLMAYGHREEGNCNDIELMVAPAPGTGPEIIQIANGLSFRGKTPLSDAVLQAAEILGYEQGKATVILITDGVETCRADPCAMASELAHAGVDFTAHVIGFGLSADEGQQVACLAEITGGQYYHADDAAELGTAMAQTIQTASGLDSATDNPGFGDGMMVDEPSTSTLGLASLDAPANIPAGATIEVDWSGPDDKDDYITIVEQGAPEKDYLGYARTHRGSPAKLTVPDGLGAYEIRYISNQTKTVLASLPVTLTPVEAWVSGPEAIAAGDTIEVEWSGPDNKDDYITIVEKGAPEADYGDYARTSRGSPATLTAPDGLGAYEIRYVMQQSKRVLASQLVTLTPVEAWVSGPEAIAAGDTIEVEWSGPNNKDDYITIVEQGAPEADYGDYARTSRGSPATLTAPDGLGAYEIRYVMQQSKRVLASFGVTLIPVQASLALENQAVPGGRLTVAWTGPDNKDDYITIVQKGAPEADYGDYARTSRGSPAVLTAPEAIGDYEIRYVMQQSKRVLASIPVVLAPSQASISAPETVIAGTPITVEWTGPANWEDFIEIMPLEADSASKPLREARTSQGSPLQIMAPAQEGDYVIIYRMRDTKEIVAVAPIYVEAAR